MLGFLVSRCIKIQINGNKVWFAFDDPANPGKPHTVTLRLKEGLATSLSAKLDFSFSKGEPLHLRATETVEDVDFLL